MILIKTDLPSIPACCEECPAYMTARDEPIPACVARSGVTHNHELILRRAGQPRSIGCPLTEIEEGALCNAEPRNA